MQLVEATQVRDDIPAVAAGAAVNVRVGVGDGAQEGIQQSQGVVLAIRGSGASRTFTVRKVSNNIGVERIVPIYSPKLAKIERLRQGRVRRAKLFYLRSRRGKSARIKEKMYDTGRKG